MSRLAIVVMLLAACGSKGERPAAGGSSAKDSSAAAPARTFAPDAPLPEGAAKRLGGTRFRISGRIESFAVSPDGRLIAAGGGDNSVAVWDVSGRQLFAVRQPSAFDRTSAIAFAGDHLVYGSGANPITVVSTTTWEVEREIATCTKQWVQAIVASPDGSRVAAACESIAEIRLQPVDGSPFEAIEGVKRTEHLTWSADGVWIAVTSLDDDRVHLVDVAKKKIVKDLPGITTERPNALAFSPRGAVLAYDDTQHYTKEKVRVYDVAADKELGAYDVALAATSIAWSRDGGTLAYGQSSGTYSLAVVDLATGKRRELMRPKQSLRTMAFIGRDLWVSVEQSVRAWDIVNDAELAGPAGHRAEVLALAYRPDGKALASGGEDDAARVWDLATATSRELTVITNEYGVIWIDKKSDWNKWPMSQVIDVAWSRDGARVYTASGGTGQGVLRRWAAGTGTLEVAYPLQDLHVHRFALAPDETVAYSVGAAQDHDSDLRAVRLSDGEIARKTTGVGEETLAMSPDGRLLAIQRDDAVQIVDAATGEVRTSNLPSGPRAAFAFSHDGTKIAVAEDSLLVYRVGTAAPISENYLGGTIASLAFVPDGRVVMGTSRGNVIVAQPGVDQLQVHEGAHAGAVHAIAVAPDGKSFATGGADGQILIWPL